MSKGLKELAAETTEFQLAVKIRGIGQSRTSRNKRKSPKPGSRSNSSPVRVEPGVIKVLEDFLSEARHGETIAGAIVLVRPNETICSAISASHGSRHHLVAACDYLKRDIIAETDN